MDIGLWAIYVASSRNIISCSTANIYIRPFPGCNVIFLCGVSTHLFRCIVKKTKSSQLKEAEVLTKRVLEFLAEMEVP